MPQKAQFITSVANQHTLFHYWMDVGDTIGRRFMTMRYRLV